MARDIYIHLFATDNETQIKITTAALGVKPVFGQYISLLFEDARKKKQRHTINP